MATFQTRLQTQIQPEQAVQDTSTATGLNAISEATAGFFRSQARTAAKGPSYDQASFNEFGQKLDILEQGLESGAINRSDFEIKLAEARNSMSKFTNVPGSLQTKYEAMSGRAFESFNYDTDEEYFQAQQLKSEFAVAIRPSVTAELEAQGIVPTPDVVDIAVLTQVSQKAEIDNQVNTQRNNRLLGRPIEVTPVLESVRSDYQILAESVKAALGDGIVEQSEFRSLQLSVNNLIANKYTGFETNPEINGVLSQMTGLLNDIGKGVSTTPSAVLADTIQVALKSAGFNDTTIAIARAQLEQNPQLFSQNFGTNKEGQTVADALVTIMQGNSSAKPIVDIFNKAVAPERAEVPGTNPSLLKIPAVTDNPEAYQKVVDTLSSSATTTDPNRLLGNAEARNSWLTSMNIAGSAVASQSEEYILGEKLLSVFASNGVVKNLDAVYRVDPQNAAQTNDVLQAGLSAERVRQKNELDNRLNAGLGQGQLVLVGADGKLQLDTIQIDKSSASLVGGEAGWQMMRSKISEAGGLEAFLKLPMTTVRGANPDASINVDGQTIFLKDMLKIDFNKVTKLSNNLKLIDTKLNNLEGLATKYQEETDLLRGPVDIPTNLGTQENPVKIAWGTPNALEIVAGLGEGTYYTAQDGTVKEGFGGSSTEAQGSLENPWSIGNEEAYSMVPVGAHYIAAGDPTQTIRIKGE